MRMYDIIAKKRDKSELTREEIAFLVEGYTKGDIPDYQMSALLMAIYLCGMSDREIADLTEFMARSGDTIDLSGFANLSVDKHSTGGVGDKTTLIVAPIVASLGCKVTKMSGRGLGHTGGTVDKLESIPGYKISMSKEDFIKQVEEIGIAVVGQSGNLTPADKKIYALRDVTATVDSIPLITSSIMSKKIAAGAKNIVLDVKMGSGAFMKSEEDANILAEKMVEIGKLCGRNMAAIISDMDAPLGLNIGNSLEIIEAIEILKGKKEGDLKDICALLSALMVSIARDIELEEAKALVLDAIDSKKAFQKFKEWIAHQGGDVSYIDNPEKFPKTKYSENVLCEYEGYIQKIDTKGVGTTSVILGAGREKRDDEIDLSAGIEILKSLGDYVKKGEPIAILHTNNKESIEKAKETYLNSLTIGKEKPSKTPLIKNIII